MSQDESIQDNSSYLGVPLAEHYRSRLAQRIRFLRDFDARDPTSETSRDEKLLLTLEKALAEFDGSYAKFEEAFQWCPVSETKPYEYTPVDTAAVSSVLTYIGTPRPTSIPGSHFFWLALALRGASPSQPSMPDNLQIRLLRHMRSYLTTSCTCASPGYVACALPTTSTAKGVFLPALLKGSDLGTEASQGPPIEIVRRCIWWQLEQLLPELLDHNAEAKVVFNMDGLDRGSPMRKLTEDFTNSVLLPYLTGPRIAEDAPGSASLSKGLHAVLVGGGKLDRKVRMEIPEAFLRLLSLPATTRVTLTLPASRYIIGVSEGFDALVYIVLQNLNIVSVAVTGTLDNADMHRKNDVRLLRTDAQTQGLILQLAGCEHLRVLHLSRLEADVLTNDFAKGPLLSTLQQRQTPLDFVLAGVAPQVAGSTRQAFAALLVKKFKYEPLKARQAVGY